MAGFPLPVSVVQVSRCCLDLGKPEPVFLLTENALDVGDCPVRFPVFEEVENRLQNCPELNQHTVVLHGFLPPARYPCRVSHSGAFSVCLWEGVCGCPSKPRRCALVMCRRSILSDFCLGTGNRSGLFSSPEWFASRPRLRCGLVCGCCRWWYQSTHECHCQALMSDFF